MSNNKIINEFFFNNEFIKLGQMKNIKKYFFDDIYPILLDISKGNVVSLMKSEILPLQNSLSYLHHMITGGGGSIFRYNRTIYKLCPIDSEAKDSSQINEYNIPKLIFQLLNLNHENSSIGQCSFITNCLLIPQDIKIGLKDDIFKSLYNLHLIYLMTYYILYSDHQNLKINDLDAITTIDLRKKNNFILGSQRMKFFTQYLTMYLNIKIYIGENFNTLSRILDHIIASKIKHAYIITFPLAINSSNKLSVELLQNYFKNESLDYTAMLKEYSLQIIFQVFIFYHTILRFKPNFVHKDLKLDNILIKNFPQKFLKFKLIINSNNYMIKIQSPFLFVINDFERAELESTSYSWKEDLNYLFYSINYYNNLILPSELMNLFPASNKIKSVGDINFNFKDLENIIISDTFKLFVERIE